MSGNKVKFHTLERLDINDVDSLQDLSHNSIADAVGAVNLPTSTAGGLVQLSGTPTFNIANSYITPPDFVVVAPIDKVNQEGAASLSVGYYNTGEAGNAVISFITSKTAVKTYFDANGTLPPKPGDINYVVNSHGQYYPRVYARIYTTEINEENRRFYSVENGREETRSVNTLKQRKVTFSTLSDGATVTHQTGAESTKWVEIFQIGAWVADGAGSFKPSALHYKWLMDDLLDLRHANAGGRISRTGFLTLPLVKGGAVAGATQALGNIAYNIAMNGSADSDVPLNSRGGFIEGLSEQPLYSLNGVGGMVEALRSKTVKMKANCTINLVQSAIDVNNERTVTGSVSWKYATDKGVNASAVADPGRKGWLKPSGINLDFGVFRARYPDILDKLSAGAIWTNSADAAIKQEVFRELIVQVPEQYLGWTLDVNITPVAHHYTTGAESVFSGLLSAGLSTINVNEPLRVEALVLTAANGATSTVYGFRIRWGTSISDSEYLFRINDGISFNSAELLTGATGTYRYGLHIDATLYNPYGIEA